MALNAQIPVIVGNFGDVCICGWWVDEHCELANEVRLCFAPNLSNMNCIKNSLFGSLQQYTSLARVYSDKFK